jgi:hypothetical protein
MAIEVPSGRLSDPGPNIGRAAQRGFLPVFEALSTSLAGY